MHGMQRKNPAGGQELDKGPGKKRDIVAFRAILAVPGLPQNILAGLALRPHAQAG
jgi:hypothetical protein